MQIKNFNEIKDGMVVFMPSGIQATLHKDGNNILVEYPEMYFDKYTKEQFEKIINEGIFVFSDQPTIAQQSVLMEEKNILNKLTEKGFIRESLSKQLKENSWQLYDEVCYVIGMDGEQEGPFDSYRDAEEYIADKTKGDEQLRDNYSIISAEEFETDFEDLDESNIKNKYVVTMDGEPVSSIFNNRQEAIDWANMNYSIDDERIAIEEYDELEDLEEAYKQEDNEQGAVYTAQKEKPLEYLTADFKNELLTCLDKIAREYPNVKVRQQAVTFMDELGLQEYYDTKAVKDFINKYTPILTTKVNEDLQDGLTIVAEEIEAGNKSGYESTELGNWLLNTSLDDKWESLPEDVKNYIMEKIAQPVYDGHISYTDLEIAFNNDLGFTLEALEKSNLFNEEQLQQIIHGEDEVFAYISYEISFDGKLGESFKLKKKKKKEKIEDSLHEELKVGDRVEYLNWSGDEVKGTGIVKHITSGLAGHGDTAPSRIITIQSDKGNTFKEDEHRVRKINEEVEETDLGLYIQTTGDLYNKYISGKSKDQVDWDNLVNDGVNGYKKEIENIKFTDEDKEAAKEYVKTYFFKNVNEDIYLKDEEGNEEGPFQDQEAKEEFLKTQKQHGVDKEYEEVIKEEDMKKTKNEDCYKVYNTINPEDGYVELKDWDEVDNYLNKQWGEYKGSISKENTEFGSEQDKEEFLSNFDVEIVPVTVEFEPEEELCPVCGEPVCGDCEHCKEQNSLVPTNFEEDLEEKAEEVVEEPIQEKPEIEEIDSEEEVEEDEEDNKDKETIESPEEAKEVIDNVEDAIDDIEDFIKTLLDAEEEAEPLEEMCMQKLPDSEVAKKNNELTKKWKDSKNIDESTDYVYELENIKTGHTFWSHARRMPGYRFTGKKLLNNPDANDSTRKYWKDYKNEAQEPKRYIIQIELSKDDWDQQEFDTIDKAVQAFKQLKPDKYSELVDTKNDEILLSNGKLTENLKETNSDVIEFGNAIAWKLVSLCGYRKIEDITNSYVDRQELEQDFDLKEVCDDLNIPNNLCKESINYAMELIFGNNLDEDFEDGMSNMLTNINDLDFPDALQDTVDTKEDGTLYKISDLVKEIEELKGSLKSEIEDIKNDIKSALQDTKQDLKNDFNNVENKVQDTKTAVDDLTVEEDELEEEPIEEPTEETEETPAEEPTEEIEAEEPAEDEETENVEESYNEKALKGNPIYEAMKEVIRTNKQPNKIISVPTIATKLREDYGINTKSPATYQVVSNLATNVKSFRQYIVDANKEAEILKESSLGKAAKWLSGGLLAKLADKKKRIIDEEITAVKREIDRLAQQGEDAQTIKDAIVLQADNEQEEDEGVKYATQKLQQRDAKTEELKKTLLKTSSTARLNNLF